MASIQTGEKYRFTKKVKQIVSIPKVKKMPSIQKRKKKRMISI